MNNRQLSAVFDEMADILEIKGENPFRIRSFRRVAEIIATLDFGVAESLVQDASRIRDIPGIGEGTMRKLEELVKTGQCEEHQELRRELPPSMLPLLSVKGLGPKRVKQFWNSLQVANLEDLETAARSGKLRTLPGIGEKTETAILKAIEEYRKQAGRVRLDQALSVSADVVAYLHELPEIERVEAAGSVRRRKETVGDIDILIASSAPAEAIARVLQFPGIRDVLAQGDTKASVILGRGLQVDFRILEHEAFGAALQYFTGSKEHNVVLRERAKRLGYKLSEYGVFRIADNARLAGETEEEVYRLLQLPLIPPELRENRGEFEAAETGELPELIRVTDIRGDLHMHTEASDGKDSIQAMAQAGLAAGYQYIAITDHSKALAMIGGLDERRLLEQAAAIDAANEASPGIRILKGVEVDILTDGTLDLSDEVLSSLDIVVASVHSRFNMNRAEMTERVCRALRHPLVNILAHPTGRLLGRREPYDIDLEAVMTVARDHHVVLEVNSYPDRLDLKDLHCRMARNLGVLLSIDTDSHSAGMLGFVDYGIATARRGWIRAEDVINTRGLDSLMRILKKKEYR